MANGPTTTWQRIRSLLSARSAGASSDAQLLARYAAERDDDAFTELVRRHGSMVYGVCRRVLVHAHDADDAYQATFLILSHKAASLRKADSLSCWLHGVALRVSLGLKRNLRRRKDQSPLRADVPREERDDVSWREVRCLLDEELARLPESLRQPLILCYLEGKTRDEAADQLGWSLSTFRGRLERGRDRLRWRLERRGLTLSAALLATLAARKADAAISFTTSAASAQAVTLATEVMRTMFLSKVKTAALWCLVALFLSVAVGGTAYRCVAVEPAPTDTSAPPVATKPPTPPEEDGVVKDYQAHLDSFHLGLTLQPVLMATRDDRFPFRSIQLRADNAQYTPFKRTSDVHAQITKEHAAKIVAVLAKDNFFRESVAEPDRLPKPKGNYVEIWAGYRQDRQTGPTLRWRTLDWDEHMVQQVQAIRQCVDGDAAKLLDTLLQALQAEQQPQQRAKLLTIAAVQDLDKVLEEVPGKDIERWVALDGVLPFKAWPKGLTDEQKTLRDNGLKLARTWLDKQTVEFHATRAPNFGDTIRYTSGPTKVAQQWQGQTPSELYAKDAFHINVLLIQEGYSPFVRSPQSPWDKKTLACYESAEQYAALHQKGIWKFPEYAARLKQIAETVIAEEKRATWRVMEWRLKLSTTPHPDIALPLTESLTFSPDGKLLLSVAKGKLLFTLRETNGLKEIAATALKRGTSWPLGFTNDGQAWLLYLDPLEKLPNQTDGNAYRFMNMAKGKIVWWVERKQLLRAVALSPDSKFLAVSAHFDTSRITLWDATTGETVRELGEDKNVVDALAFSPDGKLLATGSLHSEVFEENGEVKLWDVATGKLIGSYRLPRSGSCTALHFTRDGSRLFAVTHQSTPISGVGAVLWIDPRTAKILGTLEGPTTRKTSMVFAASPDGKMFAMIWGLDEKGRGDRRLRIYDTATGKELPAPDAGAAVHALAFSPDGKTLAIGTDTGAIALWEAIQEQEKAPNKSSDVPEAVIEEMLKKDAVATHVQKEIDELEVKLFQFRERTATPEKEPAYQQFQQQLEQARKALAKRRAELLDSLRK